MTSERERRLLLELAREALTMHVSGGAASVDDRRHTLTRRAGAFVSLHRGGELRGCVGYMEADQLLTAVVARSAVAAGSADPRFAALGPSELATVMIEISVLGPFEFVAEPAAIEVGRHGVAVSSGSRSALLLPQVATLWNWDSATFVAEACLKASLSPDAWRREARLRRLEAEVFREP